MTDLEKACLAFVRAIVERAEQLQEQLDESKKKCAQISDELSKARQSLAEQTCRADRAEAKLSEGAVGPAERVTDRPAERVSRARR